MKCQCPMCGKKNIDNYSYKKCTEEVLNLLRKHK